jgi:hypothetical protein
MTTPTETKGRDFGLSSGTTLAEGTLEQQTAQDPCEGKTGNLLSVCRLQQTGKQWEVRNGVFFSEGRADEAGGGLIIKGSGFKYKYGF